MKSHIRAFLIPTLIALLLGGFFLAAYSKSEIHLFINSFHTPFADAFFKATTFLGEGWLFLLALPLAIFSSFRAGLQMGLAGLFTGIFTSLGKQLMFAGAPRPISYFKDVAELYLVPGAEMNLWNSFPSGHTMAAFAIYFTLALIVKRKSWSFLFFVIALCVGYSRMYLSQHFLEDVEAGAILGLGCAWLAQFITDKLKWQKLDLNLIALFK